VTLTGELRLETFYGPPNYGENPTTDSRETQAILHLAKPICVNENPANEYEAEVNQSRITLVPAANLELKRYLGMQVTLIGSLFHAHTGHHHTPVLMQVKRIVKPHD